MKYFAILFSFVALASSLDQESFKIRPVNLQNAQRAGEKCSSEMKIDPAIFPKMADGTMPDDETSYKYGFCVATNLKLIDEQGKYNVEKVVSLVGDHPRAEEFTDALTKCNEISKGSPWETFADIYRCYFANSPILLAL